jgi:hypothetical protein
VSMSDLDPVAEAIAAEGPRRHAAWDADLFAGIARQFTHTFRWRFRDDPEQQAAWRGFLQLAAEGVGAGYLRPGAGYLYESLSTQNLLGWCLARLVPDALSKVPSGERLAALAALWNLCEGLLDEPEWVQRYVLSRAEEIDALDELEALLLDALEVAFAPATPARWSGALTVSTLDTRDAHDHFLPGEMYLAAPRVLCVADRRDPETHTAVFLERGGCRVMGPTGRLPPYEDPAALPELRAGPHRLRLGDREVDLPLLSRPYRAAACAAGFAVVSAEDSQRLWVVESEA